MEKSSKSPYEIGREVIFLDGKGCSEGGGKNVKGNFALKSGGECIQNGQKGCFTDRKESERLQLHKPIISEKGGKFFQIFFFWMSSQLNTSEKCTQVDRIHPSRCCI